MKIRNVQWFKKFVNICENYNIEYMVFYGTLLGTIREKGPITWDNDFDVIMTLESYEKLKKLFPKNCLDTESSKKFPSLINKFVPDINNYLHSTLFVDIFLLISISKKHMKKYKTFINKFKYFMQLFKSPWKPETWVRYLIKYIAFPFWFLPKKLTYTEAVKTLCHPRTNIKYILHPPFIDDNDTIFTDMSFETIKKPFLNFQVNVPRDFAIILKQRYGNYMIPYDYGIKHINTLSTTKGKRK